MSTDRTHESRDGFTLVETLVVVALIGLLAGVVSAAIVVIFRNDDSVVDRLTDTRDLQNLANYLPGDVASAEVIETVADGSFSSTPCLGFASNPVLRLDWSQRWVDGVVSEFEVVYDWDTASGELIRHSCENGGHTARAVAKRFSSLSVTEPDADGTVKVEMYFGSELRRLTASSRHFTIP